MSFFLDILHNDFWDTSWFSPDIEDLSSLLGSFLACCTAASTLISTRHQKNESGDFTIPKGSLGHSAIFINHFRSPLIPLPTAWLRTKEAKTVFRSESTLHTRFSDRSSRMVASKLIGTYHFIIIYHGALHTDVNKELWPPDNNK